VQGDERPKVVEEIRPESTEKVLPQAQQLFKPLPYVLQKVLIENI
jgi:hypothetical protein